MATLRTPETEKQYRDDRESGLWNPATHVFAWEDEQIELFKHWALVPADYPYDRIAEVHHLLVPKRIFSSYNDMNQEEYEELKAIKEKLKNQYDFILENLSGQKTVPCHYHLHFIKMREDLQIPQTGQ